MSDNIILEQRTVGSGQAVSQTAVAVDKVVNRGSISGCGSGTERACDAEREWVG